MTFAFKFVKSDSGCLCVSSFFPLFFITYAFILFKLIYFIANQTNDENEGPTPSLSSRYWPITLTFSHLQN